MMSNFQQQIKVRISKIANMISTANTNKVIQHLRKIQFICQFFVLSKVSEDHDAVPEVLMVIEAFKFYFKAIAVAQSKGIYIESAELSSKPKLQIQDLMEEKSTVDQEIDRQRKLLQNIRSKPYESQDFHPNIFQIMPNGKRMQLITATNLPKKLKKIPLKFRHILGQILTVLRPLISIICIRIYGINNYKSYFISLFIDLFIILVFQRGLKVTSDEEKKEMNRRKNQIITRYLFRKPFFEILKRLVIQPLLAKIIKPQRMLSKILMSLIEMQSSISLTI